MTLDTSLCSTEPTVRDLGPIAQARSAGDRCSRREVQPCL